jgi:hypothetical protein
MTKIDITGSCTNPPPEDYVLLPVDPTPPTITSGLILVKYPGGARVMTAGVRVDHGTAACVAAATLQRLGGEKAKVEYDRAAGSDALRHNGDVQRRVALAGATFLVALLTAAFTFFKATGVAADVSVVALLILSAASALLGFQKEMGGPG